MDASDVFIAILVTGAIGWIAWAEIHSRRRARNSANPAGGTEPPGGPPQSSAGVPPATQAPTRQGETEERRGRRPPRTGG